MFITGHKACKLSIYSKKIDSAIEGAADQQQHAQGSFAITLPSYKSPKIEDTFTSSPNTNNNMLWVHLLQHYSKLSCVDYIVR